MKRKNCLVSVLVVAMLFPAECLSYGKEEARDIAAGATAIGGVALLGGPVTAAAGAGAVVGQGVGLIAMGLIDFFKSASQRPDQNHASIASVAPVAFTPISIPPRGTVEFATPQAVVDINASLQFGGLVIDNARLLDASLRKFFGALNNGNVANAELQKAAACHFLLSLEASFTAYRNSLRRVSASLQGTAFASLSVTVPQVLALRDRILRSGFPPEEAFVFAQMRATNEEIALALQEVALVTGNTISNTDLTGAVIFEKLAAAFGRIDIREFLPSGFTPNCGASAKCNAICFRSPRFFADNLHLITQGTVRIGGMNFNAPISIPGNRDIIRQFVVGDCIPPFPPRRPLPPRDPTPEPSPEPFPTPLPFPFPFPNDPFPSPIVCSTLSPPLERLNREHVAAQLSLNLAGGQSSPSVINAIWSTLRCYEISFAPTRLSNGFLFTSDAMLKDLFQQAEFAIRENRTADMIVLANLFRVLNGPHDPFGRCGLSR